MGPNLTVVTLIYTAITFVKFIFARFKKIPSHYVAIFTNGRHFKTTTPAATGAER